MRLLRIAAVAAAWMFPVAVVAWLVAASAVGGDRLADATVVANRLDERIAQPLVPYIDAGMAERTAVASRGSASPAGSSPDPGAPVSAGAHSPGEAMMRALMAWAAPRLGLPVPPLVPRIVRKTHCDLQAIAQRSDACPEPGSGVLALYDANVLWLRDDWRGDNIRDLSILFHELVHHMQHHAGVEPVPCQAQALKRPAYEAQFAFLEAAGVDPYKTIGINDLMLIFVTTCLGRH